MKRRIAALLCCVLLMLQMTVPPQTQAADYVYFVAAGENVLPMSDSTMPFWKGGYLYVPAAIFADVLRNEGRISYVYAEKEKIGILYRGDDRVLMFGVGDDFAVDGKGQRSYPGAVYRNGQIFVPASMVSDFFGLQYSVTKISGRTAGGKTFRGELVWIRETGYILSEKYFVNAAASVIALRYEEYLKSREQAQTPDDTTPQAPGEEEDMGGKRLYLCMTAGETTAPLLDALDRYGVQGTFFCTPQFLQEQGDLLRRMTATGQSIGILADARDPERSVEEQLEAGNRALERATCGRTRLARVEGGEEQLLQRLEEAGYRCLHPDLDRSAYELRSSSNASGLLRQIMGRREDGISIWLADRVSAQGLRSLLSSAVSGGSRCLAWTETA